MAVLKKKNQNDVTVTIGTPSSHSTAIMDVGQEIQKSTPLSQLMYVQILYRDKGNHLCIYENKGKKLRQRMFVFITSGVQKCGMLQTIMLGDINSRPVPKFGR